MVNFELGNEIKKDVFSSCHERGTKTKFRGVFVNGHAYTTSHDFLFPRSSQKFIPFLKRAADIHKGEIQRD